MAALTVSLAAGLAAMAARCSPGLPDGERVVVEADRVRRRAAELVDADAQAYGAVLAAVSDSRGDGADERRNRMRPALEAASLVPLEVAELGAAVVTLATRVARDAKTDVRGDADTAAVLAAAAVRSAVHLVDVNVAAGGCDEDLVRRAARHRAVASAAELEVGSAQNRPG